MSLKTIFLIYILIVNLSAIIIMFIDKQKAKNGSSTRISEKTLLSFALFLGAFGVLIGMYKFRHKTMHNKFKFGVPLLFILNLICIYFILFKIL